MYLYVVSHAGVTERFIINAAVKTTNCCALQAPRPPYASTFFSLEPESNFLDEGTLSGLFKKRKKKNECERETFLPCSSLPCCRDPSGPPDRNLQSVPPYSKPPGPSESSAASGSLNISTPTRTPLKNSDQQRETSVTRCYIYVVIICLDFCVLFHLKMFIKTFEAPLKIWFFQCWTFRAGFLWCVKTKNIFCSEAFASHAWGTFSSLWQMLARISRRC